MISAFDHAWNAQSALIVALQANHDLAFDISTTAGWYSALAAVLAGFAFNGLIVIVNMRIADGRSARGFAAPARAIIVTFIGLVLTSVSYAVMSGERGNRRIAAEELFVAIGFAVSIFLLLFAITLVLDAAASAPGVVEPNQNADSHPNLDPDEDFLGPVADFLRAFVSVVLAPVTMAFLVLAATDYKDVRYGYQESALFIDYLGYFLIAAQFVVGLVFWFGRESRHPLGGDQHHSTVRRFTVVSLAVITVCTVAFAACQSILGTDELPSMGAIYVGFGVSFLWLSTATWHFARPPYRSHAVLPD